MRRTHRPVWLALAAIAMRAVVPVGYMPAPLAAGLPFVLCPGAGPGTASLIAAIDHGGSHHHDRGEAAGSDLPAWEHCPYGTAFGVSIPPAKLDPFPAWRGPVAPRVTPDHLAQSPPARAWRARAPPTDLPIDT